MEFRPTSIEGLIEIFPKLLGDARGIFFESYKKELFAANGIDIDFVQDNQSFSEKGVLRGLHMQHGTFAQGKLVRVISGKVLDVVVDIRKDSPTFGQHKTFVLDAQLNNMVCHQVFYMGLVHLKTPYLAINALIIIINQLKVE